jgi:hypothetical protein
MPMRQDCRYFESRTYPNGDTVRKCDLDLAPHAPWRCPEDCPKYTPRMADVNWQHGTLITPETPPEPSSVADDELLAADLAPDRLLFRLFHEDGVRVYDPHPLFAGCRCSREKVETTLAGLGAAAVAEYALDDGSIVVTCEFCNTDYRLDAAELARLAGLDGGKP